MSKYEIRWIESNVDGTDRRHCRVLMASDPMTAIERVKTGRSLGAGRHRRPEPVCGFNVTQVRESLL